MLASIFPQSLCLPPGHANTPWIFQACRRHCWRRPSRKSFTLRRVTPTRPGFSRPAGVHVGADIPAKPLSSAWPRQHAPDFQGLRRHCWRRPSRKSFALRRVTPTRPGFSRPANVYVGVDLPANPLPSAWSRQHAPDFPGRPTSMLASTSPQILCLPPGHANKLRLILVALTIDILAGTSEE